MNIITSVKSLTFLLKDSFRLGKEYQSVLKVKLGAQAADFTLPNAIGQHIKLKDILKEKKVVLIFYRGGWCPFCNLQLRKYQHKLNQFEELGATILAVSPQVPDQSLTTKEKQDLKFEVLSDAGNIVASKYTTVFAYDEKSKQALKNLGYDLNDFYENGVGEVPVPAVFIIDQNGTIIFAESEGGDFKKRIDPLRVLDILRK